MPHDSTQPQPATFLYARVSTQEQSKGYSLETQLEAMRHYCSDRGYMVSGEYTDRHTGTELERPGINQLLEDAKANAPEVIVLYDVDRLGREVIVQAILEKDLTSSGARIEYVLGGDTGTPEGELLKMMKSAFAVYDNRSRVEKSKRGKRGKAKAGHVVIGRSPYGYNYIKEPHRGRLEINEEEAEIIRLIYSWLIDDRMSSHAIARRLWAEGIPHRDRLVDWSPSMVQKMFRHPVYKGRWPYGRTRRTKVNGKVRHVPVSEGEWIYVDVPAIITPERWDAAQEALEENKRLAKRNAKREYLLSGLVFCKCGWRRQGKVHGRYGYYVCRCSSQNTEWYKNCDVPSIRQERLEAAVWDYVVDQLLHPDRLLSEVTRRLEDQESEAERRAKRIGTLNKECADVDQKLGQLLTEQLDGFPKEIIDAKRDDLLDKRRMFTLELERLQAEQSERDITPDAVAEMKRLAATVQQAQPHMTFDERRNLLRTLRIRVDVIDTESVHVSGLITSGICAPYTVE